MRAGVVVFLGIFGCFTSCAWLGCSSSSASTVDSPDANAADTGCTLSATGPGPGRLPDCTCGSLTDYCAANECLSSPSEAADASAWPSYDCVSIQKSTNDCSGAIEIQGHGTDTSQTLYYDSASGALLGVVNVVNLEETCWGAPPAATCDDTWTLAPAFACDGGGD